MSEYEFSRRRIFPYKDRICVHCDTTVLGKIERNGNICANWVKALSFPADIFIPSCMPRTDCAQGGN